MSNWRIAPNFFVPDIVKAAEYYRDQLGFKFEQYWGEPPEFVMVNRGGSVIMLILLPLADKYPDMLQPNRKRDHHAWDAYIWIGEESLDELHQEFVAKGARIVSPPTKKEYYGMIEFEVMDPFGYVICFAQDLNEKSQ